MTSTITKGLLMTPEIINKDIHNIHLVCTRIGWWGDLPEVEFGVPLNQKAIDDYNANLGLRIDRITEDLVLAARAQRKDHVRKYGGDLVEEVSTGNWTIYHKGTWADLLARSYIRICNLMGWYKIKMADTFDYQDLKRTAGKHDTHVMLIAAKEASVDLTIQQMEGKATNSLDWHCLVAMVLIIAESTGVKLPWHRDARIKYMKGEE